MKNNASEGREMNRTCCSINLKTENYLGYLHIDEMTILKWILIRQVGKVWI
jgi:hypothetical protein